MCCATLRYACNVVQALQASAAAEAERRANSSKARIDLEEQMKERQVLQLQQQVTCLCLLLTTPVLHHDKSYACEEHQAALMQQALRLQ